MLYIHSAQLISWWEAIHLAIGNSPHQCRLADTVGTTETIAATTDKAHGGVVEQDLSTVCQGELTVAQLLTLLLRKVTVVTALSQHRGCQSRCAVKPTTAESTCSDALRHRPPQAAQRAHQCLPVALATAESSKHTIHLCLEPRAALNPISAAIAHQLRLVGSCLTLSLLHSTSQVCTSHGLSIILLEECYEVGCDGNTVPLIKLKVLGVLE
eukprot:GHUV01043201.1.p1 GENE.GHUV01043201.1~~GHUV01043201.1.p1  ORF type:complete len:212 (+),score=18.18 GHUV01043201.1:184-819(+)